MIACYEGTLGGGKSYHATKHIIGYLAKGGRIYTNINLVRDSCCELVRKRYGVELDWDEQVHQIPLESMGKLNRFVVGGTYDAPTLCVCDEMHLYANSRDWASADRGMLAWLTQSRKVHVDIIFITQHRNNMDKQWVRLVGEFWRFKDLRKWVVPGLGIRLPWYQMLSLRIDTDGKTVLTRSWERIDKPIFDCYSSDQLFDGFADCAGRGLGRVQLQKTKRKGVSTMKLIIIGLLGIAVAAYFGIKYPPPFLFPRHQSEASSLPSPASPPSPASLPSQPPPKRIYPDRGLSWWGERGQITGGQGESGYVYNRSPDRVIDGTPYWQPRPHELRRESETPVQVPRGTPENRLDYLGIPTLVKQ